MPLELTVIAVAALLAGLLLVAALLAGRRGARGDSVAVERAAAPGMPGMLRVSPPATDESLTERESRGAETTLRLAWWVTVYTVVLAVGISGSFAEGDVPIFVLGAVGFAATIVFHELGIAHRSGAARFVELVVATALVAGLLTLTGWASSPFAMLFALVAVAAALAYGPRAGLLAAVLATLAFGAVLGADPNLPAYAAEDALRLSIGLGATWLLAFVAIAYAGRQRRAVAHVLALSRTDPLTGLFNRSQLFTTLEQEVSRTRRSDRGFCILMIDLDGLKVINDTAGHLRGDAVLKSLGRVIRSSIRTVDSAYRFGGDEFVVLLPETDIVGAFVVAEKIRTGAEDLANMLGGTESVTSVSIGLVSHPEDGLSAEELMTAADRAMYQAKKLGKNQISGNPRARPALLGRRGATGTDASRDLRRQPAAEAAEETEAAPRPATAPAEDRAVAVELPPVAAPHTAGVPVGPRPAARGAADRRRRRVGDEEPRDEHENDNDEADAGEVRRQIAAASRSFDPDHQIRRAMDAFLSPSPAERQPPEH